MWSYAKIRVLMRRSVSIAVVMVILASALAQFTQVQSSTVPACCRAGGKHHCGRSMRAEGSVGFKAEPESCPYRHPAAMTSDVVALTSAVHRIAIFVVDADSAQPSVLAAYLSGCNDTHKRGPPIA